ncbi:hypothetical protein ABDK56_00195 [Sphingomonas sp. ASV193]|uniref:hypothetical protein n=1 Tax=Sphingomonas sp. ASV193 TaxID=3144405 RepID=UPI0032E92A7D
MDANRVLENNLILNSKGGWLTGYPKFGRMPIPAKVAADIPWVRRMCSPAVSP